MHARLPAPPPPTPPTLASRQGPAHLHVSRGGRRAGPAGAAAKQGPEKLGGIHGLLLLPLLLLLALLLCLLRLPRLLRRVLLHKVQHVPLPHPRRRQRLPILQHPPPAPGGRRAAARRASGHGRGAGGSTRAAPAPRKAKGAPARLVSGRRLVGSTGQGSMRLPLLLPVPSPHAGMRCSGCALTRR